MLTTPHRRSPQVRLHPGFRRAILRSGRKMWVLAQLGEFPALSQFSHVLHADGFSATPLVLGRLVKVAEVIDFPVDNLIEPVTTVRCHLDEVVS